MTRRLSMLYCFCLATVVAFPGHSFAGFLPFLDDFEDGDHTDGQPVTWEPNPFFPGGSRNVINGDLVMQHSARGPAGTVVQESRGTPESHI